MPRRSSPPAPWNRRDLFETSVDEGVRLTLYDDSLLVHGTCSSTCPLAKSTTFRLHLRLPRNGELLPTLVGHGRTENHQFKKRIAIVESGVSHSVAKLYEHKPSSRLHTRKLSITPGSVRGFLESEVIVWIVVLPLAFWGRCSSTQIPKMGIPAKSAMRTRPAAPHIGRKGQLV